MSCRIQLVAVVGCLLTGVVCLPGCGRSEQNPIGPASSAQLSADELVVGQPLAHGNLMVFPVSSKTPLEDDRFITLDQGLKAGTVEVREMGSDVSVPPNGSRDNAERDNPFSGPTPTSPQQAIPQEAPQAAQSTVEQPVVNGNSSIVADTNPFAAQANADALTANRPMVTNNSDASSGANANSESAEVNRLLVVNKSDRPLYLMPGEIIVGGEQDRVVGQEYIIAAHSGPTPIDVFCVEQGRWQPKDATALSGFISQSASATTWSQTVAVSPEAADASSAAAESAKGKFVAAVGNLSKDARLAVQADKDQLQVWDKVSKENAKANTESSTHAFTTNYASDDLLKRLEPFLEKLKDPVSSTSNIVGVVVAINGKVESLDVFQSTPLFRQLWPKLLKSYALDAANSASDEQSSPACSISDARQFLSRALTAQAAETHGSQNVMVTTRQTDQLISFAAAEGRSSPSEPGNANSFGGMGGGGGGFGGAVHVSGFAK